MLTFYKLQRLEIFSQMAETYSMNSTNLMNSAREINAMMLVPLINEDMENLLKQYFAISPLEKKITLSTNLKGFYNFTVPATEREKALNDLLWLSPMILSGLTAEQFFKVLVSILLEKSVIFVSDNIPLLSSAVLGLQVFLNPFKWCHVSIPILPQSLLDMIEAPMPIMVGLLKSHLD